jgi:hypothetical protein
MVPAPKSPIDLSLSSFKYDKFIHLPSRILAAFFNQLTAR